MTNTNIIEIADVSTDVIRESVGYCTAVQNPDSMTYQSVAGLGFCGGCHKLAHVLYRQVYEQGHLLHSRFLSSCCLRGLFMERDCRCIVVAEEQLWPSD